MALTPVRYALKPPSVEAYKFAKDNDAAELAAIAGGEVLADGKVEVPAADLSMPPSVASVGDYVVRYQDGSFGVLTESDLANRYNKA